MAQRVKDLALATASAKVEAVAWIKTLARELPHALGVAKKKKKKKSHGKKLVIQ